MIITLYYLRSYNKWYSDKNKKKEVNDSINHKIMLSKNICIKIIGPRFWQGIYLIESPLLEHFF